MEHLQTDEAGLISSRTERISSLSPYAMPAAIVVAACVYGFVVSPEFARLLAWLAMFGIGSGLAWLLVYVFASDNDSVGGAIAFGILICAVSWMVKMLADLPAFVFKGAF